LWKFSAQNWADSALRRPWKSAYAQAGESTKLSGNFSASLAIFAMSFRRTALSSLPPLRTDDALAALNVTGNSFGTWGASTTSSGWYGERRFRYFPRRAPTWAKYTWLGAFTSVSSSNRVQPSPGGMSGFCTWPDAFWLPGRKVSKASSSASAISFGVHRFLSKRSATRLTSLPPVVTNVLPTSLASSTASGL